MNAIKAQFTLNESPIFNGYHFGQTWNGWACPYFELDIALKAMEYYNEGNEDSVIRYDDDKKQFIETFDGEDYIVTEVEELNVDGKTIKVHSLGHSAWVWWNEKWNNDINQTQ